MVNGKFQIVSIILLLLLTMSSALAIDNVLINSNDWKDQYIATVFAAREDAEIFTFSGLSDMQVKLKTISESSEIMIFEPAQDFIIKDMKKYLETQGFSSVQSTEYSSIQNLQSGLFSYDSNILVLNSAFGSEAISTFLLTSNEGYDPYFVTQDTISELSAIATSDKSVLIIGRFPFWIQQQLPDADVSYLSFEEDNIEEFMTSISSDYEWGLMMEPGNVDLISMSVGNPIFLYTGDPEKYADLVESSGIINYEVIGGDLVNLASGVEQEVGYDLKLLVKYARTVTGIDSLRGQLLDIDAVSFPFPLSFLEVRSAKQYATDNIVTVTYANTGTVDVYFSSTIEAGSSIVSTDRLYMIRAGSLLEIPFNVSEAVTSAVVNTQYGRTFPLTQTVLDSGGFPLVTLDVVDADAVPADPLEIKSLHIDDKGVLSAKVTNPNSVKVNYVIQVYTNSSSQDVALPLSSKLTSFEPKETKEVQIDASFTDPALLTELTLESVSHFGPSAQWYTSSQGVYVEKEPSTSSLAIIIGVSVAILIVLVLLVFVVLKKK